MSAMKEKKGVFLLVAAYLMWELAPQPVQPQGVELIALMWSMAQLLCGGSTSTKP